MAKKPIALESLNDHYPAMNFLSPIWQVIYQEGIRSNHLMFSHEELAKFATESSANPLDVRSDADHLIKVMSDLLACPDLQSIKTIIARLNDKRKRGVFVLYQRYLETWRCQLKESLN